MTIAATVTHTKTLTSPSSGTADKVYGSDYVSASSHTLTWSGLGTNQLLYSTGATALAQSANLLFTDTPARFQVGSGTTTNQGVVIGYSAASGYAAMWPTGLTTDLTNYFLSVNSAASETSLNAISGGNIYGRFGGTLKSTLSGTAGAGLTLATGTATTDVQALSATQTWNAAGVAFTAVKATITNTASAAGSKLIDLIVGSSSQFAVSPTGLITTGGTDGVATFGPAAVASITVKNGIITAIS